jgi:HK97 family phage prohead protease
MKSKIKITQKLLDEHGIDVKIDELEEPVVKRLVTTGDITIDKNEESTVVGYISTIDVDSDGDIVLPDALNLERYKKNPIVLYNHNMNAPVGVSEKIKVTEDGILSKTRFGSTSFAQDIFTLVKDKILKTFSVGFIPLKYLYKGTEEYDSEIKRLKSENKGRFTKDVLENASRIVKEAILFESSICSVPANENSLALAVSSKGFTEETCKILGVKNIEPVEEVQEEVQEEVIEEPIEEPIEEQKTIEPVEEVQEDIIEEEKPKMKIIGNIKDIKVIGNEPVKDKPKMKIIGHDYDSDIKMAIRLASGKIS